MVLTDILVGDRVGVARGGKGLVSKDDALTAVAGLLARGSALAPADFRRVLAEREALQSTGIGDGVAIPHGALDQLDQQVAALFVCPDGVAFDSIDGNPAKILFAVVGPKRATAEHLKTLARVSRLLRDPSFRERLLAADDAAAAFELIRAAEDARPPASTGNPTP